MLHTMPIYLVILHSFPETLILLYLGLLLTDSLPKFRKIILIAILGTAINYFIRILGLDLRIITTSFRGPIMAIVLSDTCIYFSRHSDFMVEA